MKFNTKALIASGLTLVATASQAALPAGVSSTVTAMSADMQSIFDLVFPVIALGVGLVVVIKLFKRFTSKA